METITFYMSSTHAWIELSQPFQLYPGSSESSFRNFVGLNFFNPNHTYADKDAIEPKLDFGSALDTFVSIFDPNTDLSIRSSGSVIKKVFEVTDAEYQAAVSSIQQIAINIRDDKSTYDPIGNNCIDFAQNIWSSMGRSGAWTNFIAQEELANLADNWFNFTTVRTYTSLKYDSANGLNGWTDGARFVNTDWSVTLYDGTETTLGSLLELYPQQNASLVKKTFTDGDGEKKVLLTADDLLFDGEFNWYVLPQHNLVLPVEPFDTLTADPKQAGGIIAIDDANGSAKNIVGTDRSDSIIGTKYDETIFGGAGNDVLFGGGGNDTLIGVEAENVFQKDVLVGGTGADTYVLSNGNSSFYMSGVNEWQVTGERLEGGSSSEDDYAVIPYYNPAEGDTLKLLPQYNYYRMPVSNTFFQNLGYQNFNTGAVSIEVVADIDGSGGISTGDQTVAIIGANESFSGFNYGLFTG